MKQKYYLLFVFWLLFICQNNSTPILKKYLATPPTLFTPDGCKSNFILSIEDSSTISTIASQNNTITFKIFKNENTKYLVQIEFTTTYAHHNDHLDISVTNALQQSNLFTLSGINCPAPHEYLLPESEPVLDLYFESFMMAFYLDTKETENRPPMTCVSNIGNCGTSQVKDSPSQIYVYSMLNQNVLLNDFIEFKLTNIKGQMVYEKSFANPFQIDSATYTSSPYADFWSEPISSGTNYLIKSFKIQGQIGSNIYLANDGLYGNSLTPVLGNDNSQVVLAFLPFPAYDGDTEKQFSFYKRSNDSLFYQEKFHCPTRNSIPMTEMAHTFMLNTNLDMVLLSFEVTGADPSTPTIFSSTPFNSKSIPFPYGYKKDSVFRFSPVVMAPRSFENQKYTMTFENILNQKLSKSYPIPSQSPIDNHIPDFIEIVSKRVYGPFIAFQIKLSDIGTGVFSLGETQDKKNYAIDTLISGSLNNGIFEFVLDTRNYADSSSALTLWIADLYGFERNIDSLSMLNYNLYAMGNFFNENIGLTIDDFLSFDFSTNTIDSSFEERRVSLFFKITSNRKDLKPIFYITEALEEISSFQGEYDQVLDMYRIDFTVFRKTFVKKIHYIISIQESIITSFSFRSRFRESAELKVVRSDIDRYPPMFSAIEYINNVNQLSLTSSSTGTIGWRFTIKDRPNGFKYGNITIISDIDPYPRTFAFDQSNFISGDGVFESVYEVKIQVTSNMVSQKFLISQVYLEDKYGRESKYPSELTTLSPFYELGGFNHKIEIISPTLYTDSVLPTLTELTITPTLNNIYLFTIKVKDLESGINVFRPPTIYLQTYDSIYQNFTTKYISSNQNIYTFQVSGQVDNLLTYYGCHLSIYGIYDNQLNLNGYSSIDLQNLGFLNNIKTSTLPLEPVIESTSKITQLGGDITIYGKRFKESSLVYLNNQLNTPLFISYSVIVLKVPPLIDTFQIKVSTGPSNSNVFSVIPTLKSHHNSMYVDPSSPCETLCGSYENPFNTIKAALQAASSYNTIVLKDGVYKGVENTEIVLTKESPIEISSMNGNSKAIIDCENFSFSFKVYNSLLFQLSDVTIKNCVSNKGGALYFEDSESIISNVQFINNQGTNGGAVYSFQSKISFDDCLFYQNMVLKNGASIYSYLSSVEIKGDLTFFRKNINSDSLQNRDILCRNSTIDIADHVSFDKGIFKCFENCDSSYLHRSLCTDDPLTEHTSNLVGAPKCGDDICSGSETCITCPNDCSCYFNGLVQETYKSDCSIISFLPKDYYSGSTTTNQERNICISMKKNSLTNIKFDNLLGGIDQIVVRLFGYVSVESSKYLSFLMQGTNVGLLFKVNGLLQKYFNQVSIFNETIPLFLTDKHTHFIEIILFSSNIDGSDRTFSLAPFTNPNDKIFFSNLVCNDGLLNDHEKKVNSVHYCPSDHNYPQFKDEPYCGDGICNEEKNSCFRDCHTEYTKTCAARTVPEKHIAPGFMLVPDTIGHLIKNQFIWRLPGSEHLSYGMNIITAEEAPSPLFQFDYCENMVANVIEDPYRGNVYQIPPEFNGKSYPKCTFSTSTESFSSTAEMSSSQEDSSSIDFSADAKVSGGFVSGGGGVAFSLEKSSKESNKMSSSISQKIFKTDMVCKTSYVEMDLDRVSLHPNVLKELDNIKNTLEMVELIKLHGTHFYKKTFLGGKLTQLTITSESEVSSENESDWSESASASLSASVSGPSFSVDASVSASIDKSQSTSEQQSKSESSTTSRMLIYGGAPAAFSPAQDGLTSPGFKKWTHSIDTLPVPLEYQLYPIREIIKKEWKNKHGVKLQETWKDAENIFYAMNNVDEDVDGIPYSLIFEWETLDQQHIPFVMYDYPILKITYSINSIDKDKKPTTKLVDFVTPIIFTATDFFGKKTKYLFSDRGDNPDFMVKNAQVAFSYSINSQTSYDSYDYKIHSNMRQPFRFDFRAPDFINSKSKPTIQIIVPSAYPQAKIKYSEPPKIISWENSIAILFNEGGIIDSPTTYYATTVFENKWGWLWGQYIGPDQSFPDNSGISFPDGIAKCDASISYFGCTDYVAFYYRGRPYIGPSSNNTVTPDKIHRFGINYNTPFRHTTFWHNFHSPIPENPDWPKEVFYIENINNIGMVTRINWLKIFYPHKDIATNWKFEVLGYHIKDNQHSESPSQEWLGFPELHANPNSNPNFHTLSLIQHSQPKQLFFYPNYNFRLGDFEQPKSIHYPYYTNIYQGNPIDHIFIEDGQSFKF
ncbi:hypothetical protein CYY_009025 [Polysphondylium violaceum]|uniref:MACPF domain-containing protein n=1 Tax=Polysphondylium violaceum TaxID=133409 RepID=A0A8J4PUA5_9MYCE|nr:hypothetical protein CYY_009025 [Polysphondylium violaceum]